MSNLKEGCWAGSKPPFGYYRDPKTKKLAINEEEAGLARRIYSEYNSGKSLHAIANMLNKENAPTRRKGGQGWRATAVRHLLINPVYKGSLVVNRYANISDLKKIDLGKAITIQVPPIIPESSWQLAQERLDTNKHVKPKEDGVFILQGLIHCGICHYAYRTERMGERRYYECRGRLKASHLDGSERCPSQQIRAD
jgi:site-specific DNA recombinase